MTIAQLLEMPVGYKIDGFLCLTVKTCKKTWQVENDWQQKVILTDKTGDMLADINIVKHNPIIRGSLVRIVVGEIQAADITKTKDAKKLYIDRFLLPIPSSPAEMDFSIEDYRDTVRGKVRTWLVASMFQSGKYSVDEIAHQISRDVFGKIVEFVMEGKNENPKTKDR